MSHGVEPSSHSQSWLQGNEVLFLPRGGDSVLMDLQQPQTHFSMSRQIHFVKIVSVFICYFGEICQSYNFLCFSFMGMFSSVQLLSRVWLCDPMDYSMPGLPVHHQLPEFTQTLVHWVSDAIQPSSVLPFSSSLQSFPASGSMQMRIFHIRRPKYWSFRFSISPSNEYSGLISFRMDWLYVIAIQGTLKSLLQHHSSKTSILWCSAFVIVQLSHPDITTVKTIALTRWIFVGKVISLLFNMLSRLVIAFLPRSKCLLISWGSHHLQWF